MPRTWRSRRQHRDEPRKQLLVLLACQRDLLRRRLQSIFCQS